MSFDCKTHFSNCVVCNRAKPSRQGSSSLSPLGITNHLWGNVGMDFATDIPKSSKHNFADILILVCHFAKNYSFVRCHKEMTTNEFFYLSIDNCYKLRGVPKVIVSDRDPRYLLASFGNHL
jgi:hypothetical protein